MKRDGRNGEIEQSCCETFLTPLSIHHAVLLIRGKLVNMIYYQIVHRDFRSL